MNFSWAMDLDPKGANNQFEEAIDPAINRFPVTDDDEDVTGATDAGDEDQERREPHGKFLQVLDWLVDGK